MHADARKLLWDARAAAERVTRFTTGRTFAEYEADDYFRSAVERQFERQQAILKEFGTIQYDPKYDYKRQRKVA